MLDIRRLSDDFSVSPQIAVTDLQSIWDAGFRSIICNRPDNEDPGQPSVDEIETAATKTAAIETALVTASHRRSCVTQRSCTSAVQAQALRRLQGCTLLRFRSGGHDWL